MTANHYQILGVAPGAEGAAIRSAYRALMRVYHPDRNDDPEAQSRAREITAAFAILGDPEKRAAYDARTFGMPIGDQPWLEADRRPRAPLRRVGMACVAVALMLSLTLAVRPQWPAAPASRGLPKTAPKPASAPAVRPADPAPARESVAAPAAETADSSGVPTAPAVVPPPAAPVAVPQPSNSPAPPPSPELQVAQPAMREAPPPLPPRAEDVAGAESSPAPDGHHAEIERLAAGFLKQSLEHADWNKQQLLLSARNRAATSRHLCRSDDCVTDAYLRQIRDTTTIMEGRIPAP
jgi:hypothetical protein